MKKLILLVWLVPFSSQAREGQGIKFLTGLSWNEIKAKAKKENKYVFLDVNATWCGPCRKMEAEVFPLQEVGALYNNQFLSVSVQTDQTRKDNEEVKKWYATAKEISASYAITVLPTYLYLSPDGELVYRSSGYQSKEDFLRLAKTALDPKSNFSVRRIAYYRGEMTDYQKREFALAASRFGERPLADSVAIEYKKYLNTASQTELTTKENIDFITYFYRLISSDDKYFELFYNQEKRMDSLMGKTGRVRTITDYVITKEEITDKLWDGTNPKQIVPDWNGLENAIQKKYPDNRSRRMIVISKGRWYKEKKDWQQVIQSGIELIELDKIDAIATRMDALRLNNFVYSTIFKYGTDKGDLKKALQWMEKILAKYGEKMTWLDTYANVLYKLGLREQALENENKALSIVMGLDPGRGKEETIKQFNMVIEKMNAGNPTW